MKSTDATPWLIVCGGFHRFGGMDKANLALAEYLLEQGTPVHLVAHEFDPEITRHPLVTAHLVQRPLHSIFLGSLLLDRRGRQVGRALKRRWPGLRMVVNGGNCLLDDVNWSHYVHSAWKPSSAGKPLPFRLKSEAVHRIDCFMERRAYRTAKLVITNSDFTKVRVEKCLSGPSDKVRTLYLGCDEGWGQVSAEERAEARGRWRLRSDSKVAVFVGALGYDHRKGFDVLFDAWKALSRESGWDVVLLVAGEGGALPYWKEQVAAAGLSDQIRFLGFFRDVPSLLAAADLMISPVRYEPYGLNLQEALCRGLAVLTSSESGIAERFPAAVKPLLLSAVDAACCVDRLKLWRSDIEGWRTAFRDFGDSLRSRNWRQMAEEMASLIRAEGLRNGT
jgi:glycosyltransferase involved in cell wall biosynthesis